MKKTLLALLFISCICSLSFAQTTFSTIQNIDGPPEFFIFDNASLNGGSGYSDAINVPVTGGTGIGATVNITTLAGAVTSVIINNPGIEYNDGETLTITGGNGDATIDILDVDEEFLGFNPTFVVSGDLDGDTDIDIAVGTYYFAGIIQDYIKWYQNDGDGNFTLQNSVSESIRWVQGLIIADVDAINGNGNDIVATAAVGSKLVYYPNNGAGGFGSEVVISNTINDPGQVVAGDIDMDGHLDLVVTSYSDNETIWFKGDGIGGFIEQTATPIQSGGNGGPWYIDIADFDGDTNIDGDTDLDILVGFYNNGGSIEIYYNQYVESGGSSGGGSVSWVKDLETVDSSVGFLGVPTDQIAFADVNNDGVLDVIECNNQTGEVVWFNKPKDGIPTPNQISPYDPLKGLSGEYEIDRPGTVLVSDLDNDGNNDVIVTDGGSQDNSIIWYKGANGASPSSVSSLVVDNNFQYWSIIVDDFDGDTDKDIAAVGVFSDTLDWFENEWNLLGINDTALDKISIYPNPTKDILNFKGSFNENITVSVYDILGKSLIQQPLDESNTLDVSKLHSGIYILNFENYSETYKFVKE